jgi:hypothetical protein
MLTISQQQDLRVAVLDFLAARYPIAYAADAIARMLRRRQVIDYSPISSEMVSALAWLEESKLAAREFSALAVIPSWRATNSGAADFQTRRLRDNPEEGATI